MLFLVAGVSIYGRIGDSGGSSVRRPAEGPISPGCTVQSADTLYTSMEQKNTDHPWSEYTFFACLDSWVGTDTLPDELRDRSVALCHKSAWFSMGMSSSRRRFRNNHHRLFRGDSDVAVWLFPIGLAVIDAVPGAPFFLMPHSPPVDDSQHGSEGEAMEVDSEGEKVPEAPDPRASFFIVLLSCSTTDMLVRIQYRLS